MAATTTPSTELVVERAARRAAAAVAAARLRSGRDHPVKGACEELKLCPGRDAVAAARGGGGVGTPAHAGPEEDGFLARARLVTLEVAALAASGAHVLVVAARAVGAGRLTFHEPVPPVARVPAAAGSAAVTRRNARARVAGRRSPPRENGGGGRQGKRADPGSSTQHLQVHEANLRRLHAPDQQVGEQPHCGDARRFGIVDGFERVAAGGRTGRWLTTPDDGQARCHVRPHGHHALHVHGPTQRIPVHRRLNAQLPAARASLEHAILDGSGTTYLRRTPKSDGRCSRPRARRRIDGTKLVSCAHRLRHK